MLCGWCVKLEKKSLSVLGLYTQYSKIKSKIKEEFVAVELSLRMRGRIMSLHWIEVCALRDGD